MERKQRRPKVRRFTAPRRAEFLDYLRQTGNFGAAARAVEINRSSAEQRRKRDAEFAIGCAEALAESDRRLAGAEGAFDCPGHGEFNVIKRGRGGRTQIVRAGAKRWSRTIEDRFFAALSMCGNVAAAARAVGFTESCIWRRRRTWPDFRQRMEDVLDDAEIRIEYRLAAIGSDVAAAGPGRSDGSEGTGNGGQAETEAEPIRFDPDLGFRFLKWREDKRRGRSPRGGRPEKRWTFEESIQLLDKKLKAFGAREEKRMLAEGWSRDEEGRLIPPGWVRAGDRGNQGSRDAENGDSYE